eukprot:6726424-Pyramimonas_sp.AAC.1
METAKNGNRKRQKNGSRMGTRAGTGQQTATEPVKQNGVGTGTESGKTEPVKKNGPVVSS